MSINKYLVEVNKHYRSGHATEHTYRGDFASLIKELIPNLQITNEPSNVTDCGNPDFVITKGVIPIGFIEAKDTGKDLNSTETKEVHKVQVLDPATDTGTFLAAAWLVLLTVSLYMEIL